MFHFAIFSFIYFIVNFILLGVLYYKGGKQKEKWLRFGGTGRRKFSDKLADFFKYPLKYSKRKIVCWGVLLSSSIPIYLISAAFLIGNLAILTNLVALVSFWIVLFVLHIFVRREIKEKESWLANAIKIKKAEIYSSIVNSETICDILNNEEFEILEYDGNKPTQIAMFLSDKFSVNGETVSFISKFSQSTNRLWKPIEKDYEDTMLKNRVLYLESSPMLQTKTLKWIKEFLRVKQVDFGKTYATSEFCFFPELEILKTKNGIPSHFKFNSKYNYISTNNKKAFVQRIHKVLGQHYIFNWKDLDIYVVEGRLANPKSDKIKKRNRD